MVRLQAGMAVIAAALAFAPAASACDEPSTPDERERVAGEAGGKAEIQVPNTLEDARWELRIEDGDELAHGVDEDPEEGVTVLFEVPDLGEDARKVDLRIDVRHEADGAEWSYDVELDYRGRPAPEPAEEPAPPPAAEQPPVQQEPPPQQPEPEREASSPAAPASVDPPPPPPAAAPAEPAQAAPPADRMYLTPGASASAPTAVEPAGTTLGLASSPPALSAGARGAAERRPRRKGAGRHARPVPQPDTPAAEPRRALPAARDEGGIRLPDVDLPSFGAGLLWTLIVAGGLSFAAAGLALGGLARHRRRRRLALR